MEKTLTEADVSFLMLILRCVTWYSTVNVWALRQSCDDDIKGGQDVP